jgi:hypothetical protein
MPQQRKLQSKETFSYFPAFLRRTTRRLGFAATYKFKAGRILYNVSRHSHEVTAYNILIP